VAEKEQLGVRLDAELVKRIRQSAAETHRTFTTELSLLVAEALDMRALAKRKLTERFS